MPVSEPCENCGADLSSVHGEMHELWPTDVVISPYPIGKIETIQCPSCGWTTERRLPVAFTVRGGNVPSRPAIRRIAEQIARSNVLRIGLPNRWKP